MFPDRSAALLRIVEKLSDELHRERVAVTLDSSLEADLGFDSLTRMELLLRIERAFSLSLPDQALTTALTPRDLLRLLQAGAEEIAAERPAPVRSAAQEELVQAPEAAATLAEALDWHAEGHPQRLHVHLYTDGDQEESITYAALREGARRAAGAFQERGLERGERVALMLPTGRDYLFVFLGVILAGGVPVPMYPPVRPGQLEEHLRRHSGILANASAVFLVAAREARDVSDRLLRHAPSLRAVLAPDDLAAPRALLTAPAPRPHDIAFLQYTSGSTGNPKGVVLTHRNVLANIRAMGRASAATSRDVFVSWLPLYHDMGLIGAWLGSLYFGAPLVLLSPLAFLARPHRWLRAISRHRGTISAAPNFAYELCITGIDERRLEGLDLSSWRLAINAAEPVSAETVARFQKKFAPFGLRPEALAPTFGLAESTVGLAFAPLGRGPLVDRVRREPFARLGRAVPAAPDDDGALKIVSCGRPLPGHQVRIVDESGFELGERQEGRLWFKGPSACGGYFRNPEATRRLFHGDWLDSGDLAYLAGDEIFVTGRVKEMLIRGGRHAYPYELEEAVGALPGLRKGGVAAFGSRDPRTGGERLIVMAETREGERAERDRLRRRVNEIAAEVLGMPADDVMLVAPHVILKTSSGKIRRAACRELYEAGGPRAERSWRRRARRRADALAARWPRVRDRIAAVLFALRVWGAFALITALGWPAAALLPRPAWCWAFSRAAARLLLRLAGVPLSVRGLENIPADRPCVLAVNHASYVDSLLLLAALRRPFRFVAKAELASFAPLRLYLRNLGVDLVERFDARQGVEDAARLAREVGAGHSLIIYPEGTFVREAGLRPFRMGAFLVAAQAGASVVPAVIRGTRSMLRDGSWFPRRYPLSVAFGPPIRPEGRDWAAEVKLRDAARAAILRGCGEPDRQEAR